KTASHCTEHVEFSVVVDGLHMVDFKRRFGALRPAPGGGVINIQRSVTATTQQIETVPYGYKTIFVASARCFWRSDSLPLQFGDRCGLFGCACRTTCGEKR